MPGKTHLLLCLVVVAVVESFGSRAAEADSILAGSDYMTTAAALVDFGVGIGPVALTGAFGPGAANTVVTRLADADLPAIGSTAVIDVQLRMLELTSVAPVFVGGSFFDVFLHLDPALPSLGSMTINHAFPDNGTPAPEGTYLLSVLANFMAVFTPQGAGAPFTRSGSLALTTPGPLPWSHEPPPGAFLTVGAPGNLDANQHAPLPPGFNDFFPLLFILQGGNSINVATLAISRGSGALAPIAAPVPEPALGALLLWGGALAMRRANRRKPV